MPVLGIVRSGGWSSGGDEVDAVVCSGCCSGGEGVEYADGEGWGHAGGDVLAGEPAEALGLIGRCSFAADGRQRGLRERDLFRR